MARERAENPARLAVLYSRRTIDIDTVNRVLLQPRWQKETDLVDYLSFTAL